MSSLDGIQSLSPRAPELRPELDRALIQSYQLAQVYNLQEIQMVTPIAYRDGADRVETSDPLLYADRPRPIERDPPNPSPRDVGVQAAPVDADLATRHAPALREREDVSASSAGASGAAGEGRQPKAGEIDDGAEPRGETALPYGADPTRIRELVNLIVSGREIVPLPFHPRQAGDILPVDPRKQTASFAAVGQVKAVYKAF